jgi:hypothetical protein
MKKIDQWGTRRSQREIREWRSYRSRNWSFPVVSDGFSPGGGNQSSVAGFMGEELRLSKKDAKNLSLLCLGGLLICIGMAVFTLASVPWDTRMPYDGKYNRSGSGIPMQIALLPIFVPLFGIWRSVKRPEAKPRTQAGRVRAYVLMVVFISVCVVGQWTFVNGILVAGGYLSE